MAVNKRVVIVDFNHMAYSYFHSQHRLSVRVMEGGRVVEKDTTITTSAIKNIHKWSGCGVNPTAVCFDRPVPARKAFFQTSFPDMQVGTAGEYKGGRERMSDGMFQGIADSERVLRLGGVSVFSQNNYEADDLISACIDRAKVKYPDLPIDVITNDADLLPLVDERVSVFLRSKKMTYAETKEIEKAKYIQVTPANYQTVVEDLSAYKGFLIPYNSLLLHKLLRGDISDNFKRKDISRMFSATKYNAMIEQMIADGVDFAHIFRYGKPTFKILYRDTGLEFKGTMAEAMASPDKAKMYQKIGNPVELDMILDLLTRYSDLTEEQLSHVEKVYWGMNLNQIYPLPDPRLARRAYYVGGKNPMDINPFNEIKLQNALTPLKIRLKGLY